MAFAISKTPLPRFTNPDEVKPAFQALKYPQLVFGMIAIFMYVGGEVSIGSMLISYITLPEIAGINAAEASIYVSIYWGGQMIGRFLGAISLSDTNNLKKYISMPLISIAAYVIIGLTTSFASANIYLVFLILNLMGFFIGKSLPNRTLYIFAFINIIFLAIALSTTGEIALWTIIGIGLFNSIMWSNIFTLAISGLGKYTSQGSSLLVMMILGGALLPLIMGMIADGYGVHISFIVPVASYIYIAFYGIRGYKPKNIS